MKEVKIVYCVPCSYDMFAEKLKSEIIKNVKDTKISLEGGRGGVLDVYVDGKLIFSKHKEGRFPEFQEIIDKVK